MTDGGVTLVKPRRGSHSDAADSGKMSSCWMRKTKLYMLLFFFKLHHIVKNILHEICVLKYIYWLCPCHVA